MSFSSSLDNSKWDLQGLISVDEDCCFQSGSSLKQPGFECKETFGEAISGSTEVRKIEREGKEPVEGVLIGQYALGSWRSTSTVTKTPPTGVALWMVARRNYMHPGHALAVKCSRGAVAGIIFSCTQVARINDMTQPNARDIREVQLPQRDM